MLKFSQFSKLYRYLIAMCYCLKSDKKRNALVPFSLQNMSYILKCLNCIVQMQLIVGEKFHNYDDFQDIAPD